MNSIVFHAVDLGLSVKWATCNLGATRPEECGDYYAWGETESKENYLLKTYKWYNSHDKLTKYNTSTLHGTVDNKTVLEAEDDVARVKLGGKWRTPADTEWIELRNACTWTWTTLGGVNGYKVTSKINGNSIFLPAAGYRHDSSLYDVGLCGNYWSSSIGIGDYTYDACILRFNSDRLFRHGGLRYDGLSVRPISE